MKYVIIILIVFFLYDCEKQKNDFEDNLLPFDTIDTLDQLDTTTNDKFIFRFKYADFSLERNEFDSLDVDNDGRNDYTLRFEYFLSAPLDCYMHLDEDSSACDKYDVVFIWIETTNTGGKFADDYENYAYQAGDTLIDYSVIEWTNEKRYLLSYNPEYWRYPINTWWPPRDLEGYLPIQMIVNEDNYNGWIKYKMYNIDSFVVSGSMIEMK